MENRKKQERER